MKNKRELGLTIWQFVRVMVELEGSGKRSLLYKSWETVWREVDAQLCRLSKEDHKAYSDLMMNQEVVLKIEKSRFWSEIRTTLSRVIKDIDDELKFIKQNDPRREDLLFERRELGNLCQSIASKKNAARG